MYESRLSILLRAYFNKTISALEQAELMELIAQSDQDEELKGLLEKTWMEYGGEAEVFNKLQGDQMLANILKNDTKKNIPSFINLPRRKFSLLGMAAAAVLFFAVAGLAVWMFVAKPAGQVKLAITNLHTAATILPGTNKAMLTLADGSSIALDSTRRGTLASQGNASVVNSNTILAYNANGNNVEEPIYNSLTTPAGGQYQLLLGDGTKVWLNASSSIRFPASFKGTERHVTITGEVYFEVAKNPAMPFTVTAKDATVQVFGTHFNIMSYDDEPVMSTTLLEGSVKITSGTNAKMLVPGQQSNINKTGDIKINEADIEKVMAWKNGWFQFNALDIETIMRQVARWYNVDVDYKGQTPSGHFSGMVNRDNSIDQVLNILKGGGVDFSIKGKKITVFTNPRPL